MIDNEGILQICTIQNTASPGYMPVEQLVESCTSYYRKKTVGYNRLYAAMGANQSIDMVVRCFNLEIPTYTEQLYVLFPNEETQFRVSMMQEIVDEGAVDLTLERLEEFFDVSDLD